MPNACLSKALLEFKRNLIVLKIIKKNESFLFNQIKNIEKFTTFFDKPKNYTVNSEGFKERCMALGNEELGVLACSVHLNILDSPFEEVRTPVVFIILTKNDT